MLGTVRCRVNKRRTVPCRHGYSNCAARCGTARFDYICAMCNRTEHAHYKLKRNVTPLSLIIIIPLRDIVYRDERLRAVYTCENFYRGTSHDYNVKQRRNFEAHLTVGR